MSNQFLIRKELLLVARYYRSIMAMWWHNTVDSVVDAGR